MQDFLTYTVVLLIVIVLIGFFNEKVTKLTYEIALMLFAVFIGAVITLIASASSGMTVLELLTEVRLFDLEGFLMKGVLCFMLFAGSCHMKLSDFRRLARPIGVLSFFCTLLGAVFYGGLFYLVGLLAGLDISLPACLMFGSIVAPTDPIAATGILSKLGLPRDTGILIEGESLLNDGVGVALYVCFSGMVTQSSGGGFLYVMFRELIGAVIVGTVVTIPLFLLFKRTIDSKRRIYISLLTVALAYFLSDRLECSGAIASVVCGLLFAALRSRDETEAGEGNDVKAEADEEFDDFWGVFDNLLNSVLYVILGFTFMRILQMRMVLILSLAAVICNLLARSGSLFAGTFLMGKVPDGFSRWNFVKLLTWSGLHGGLSIALAMNTATMLSDDTYHIVLGCTYAIVFFTTVVQGLTVKKVYESIT